MGDLESLLETAREAMSEEQAEDMGKKFLKGEFNLIDMYEQMGAMSKMGSLSKIVNMIPGMGNANIPKDMLKGQEAKMKNWKHLMNSMTKHELENPDLIRGTRLDRITSGSGQSSGDLRLLLKQYKQGKKMAKMMKGGMNSEKDMQKLMQKMSKGKMSGKRF
jgi:signal recognition particle subunit SRP54